jgi:hypothetical protein
MEGNIMYFEIKYENFKPVRFYGYAHGIVEKITEIEYDDGDDYKTEKKQLIEYFKKHGIKAHDDNKIVFQLENPVGNSIFIGFYDWKLSIGFSVIKI